ncbi:MAG TPA: hypothetical protein VGD63_17410 [Steroidobacteraceae bacterium]
MPGSVCNDKFALVGGKESIGHVDGDALFALGGQAIDQQREIDVLTLGTHALAVRIQRSELIFKDHFGVVQKPADQRRFAVIDRSAGDEPKQRFVLMAHQILINVLGHELRWPVRGTR